MSDIPTVTYYAYSGTQYIGQYSGEDSAVLAFIAGKGWTTGPKPLATDRDLWVSIVADATAAQAAAAASASEAAAVAAARFDGISGLAASGDLTDGEYYTASSAFNGEPETFLYDADSTATADGALIVDATGMGAGRLVSTRKSFTKSSEFISDDPRGYGTFSEGDVVSAGLLYYRVAASDASDQDGTTDGGVKYYNASIGIPVDGRVLRLVAGAIRNDGTGWDFIEDSEHSPVYGASVSLQDSQTLRVSFDGTNTKVVSAICGVDESLARSGLIPGPSVAAGYMDIRASAPLEFKVQTDGTNAPIVTASPQIASTISSSRSGYKARINHNTIKSPPQVTRAAGSPPVVVDSLADGSFNLHQETSASSKYYRVRYVSGWQLLTNDTGATLDSSSFTTNGNLVVTLGTALTGNDFAYQTVSSTYNRARITLPGLTTFTMRFVDAAGATITTEANSTTEAYITYGPPTSQLNASTTLPAGTYYVSRGRTLVNWADVVSPDEYSANSNIWFMALVDTNEV